MQRAHHLFRSSVIVIALFALSKIVGLFRARLVAQAFGIGLDRIRITATTTGKVPNTSATAASSGSDLNGMAALKACDEIKARMVGHLEAAANIAPESVTFAGGQVSWPGGSIAFSDLARACLIRDLPPGA